jgi:hypothetical protein
MGDHGKKGTDSYGQIKYFSPWSPNTGREYSNWLRSLEFIFELYFFIIQSVAPTRTVMGHSGPGQNNHKPPWPRPEQSWATVANNMQIAMGDNARREYNDSMLCKDGQN